MEIFDEKGLFEGSDGDWGSRDNSRVQFFRTIFVVQFKCLKTIKNVRTWLEKLKSRS